MKGPEPPRSPQCRAAACRAGPGPAEPNRTQPGRTGLRTMTPGLPLLLLALALRRAQGNAGASPGPPPVPPELSCGAEVLEAVLGRLRALEGEVRALQGQCGDSLGPQAGTGSTAARRLCDTPGAGGCCGCRLGESGDGLPCPAPRCPLDCSDQGRCRAGRCHCFEGFTGPFCATPVCPPGRGGPHCTLEIPSVTLHLAARNQTSFRVTWPRPAKPVDGYEVAVIPMDEPAALTTHELPGSAVTFEVTGLTPGQAFEIFIQAQREQHLGAPGTLRVRTLLAQSLPNHGGPRGTPTFLASPVAPASPSARQSPASPWSPVSLGSLGSPASLRSPVSPESSAAPASMESPWSPASPHSPESPASPVSPRSPTSPWSPASPQSPLSPASPISPVLPNVPSLHELGVKLSSYNGSLLQRLESHLRATNFPLRGNQTVPAVARAILSYLLRRSPASLRYQFLRHLQQNPHPKPQVLPGAAGEALVDLDGLRGHAETVVIRYRLLEEPEGDEGEVRVPGDTTVARVPGLVPGATYRVEVHGVVRGRVSKSYTSLVTAGLGDTSEPPLEWGNLYDMEVTEPQGAMAKAAPSEEEPPQRPRLGMLTVSHVTPSSIQLEWSVLEGTFDSFTVQYRDAQGQPQALAVDGGSRTVTVPGLSPSRHYKFNLYGVWGRKRIGFISTDAVTDSAKPKEELPSQPRLGELTASHVSPDSVQLEWSIPEGSFDSFTVQYKDAQGQPQVVPVDGGLRTVTVPGLSPSRRYKFNLYGVWGRKRLGPMSTDAVTAPAQKEPPSQPLLGELTASHVGPDSVQLEWSVPEGSFDSFTVQYKDAQGQPQVVPVDGGLRTVTVPGLSPSRRYKFNLYGVWGRKRLGPMSTDAVTAAEETEEEPPSQPRLGELTASHVSPNSVQLEWSIPEGSFDSFTVQYIDVQGQPQELHLDSGSRTVTVSGLLPSHPYKFNLYGVWGQTRLGPISTDTITAAAPAQKEPPSQPRLGELTASHVSPDSVQLEWSVPEGSFDSFTVQYKDAQGQPQVVPVDGGLRTVTVPGLSPSRRYKFNLYGVWGRKRLGPMSTDAVTAAEETEEEPPSQPRLGELTASHVSPNSVQLEWSIPEGSFDSFTVQYIDVQGQPQELHLDSGSRTVTVSGLLPSHPYKFNLYGVWGQTRLGPISTDTITAAAPAQKEPPSQPRLGELTASHVSPDSVQLEWSVPEGSFDSFTVQYKDAQGQPQVVPVDGGLRTVTVPGLSPSRRYKFNLYGVWGRKRLGPMSTDAVTAPAQKEPPSQPLLGELTASHVGPDSVQLEWSVPEGSFDSFTVQYKDAQGQPQVVPVDGGLRTVTVPGLSPSRRYKFNLYGVWGRKRLGPMSTDAVTAAAPAQEEPPSPPRLGELTASHVGPDSVQLEWSVPEGSFDSFTVQYKDAQGQPQVVPVDGGLRTVTVPGLSPSRRYKFNLYGVWGRKRLGPMSTDAVTAAEETEEEPPSQPRLGELTASHVSPNSVQLEWSIPEGSFDSFTVQYIDVQGQPQELHLDSGSRTVTVSGLLPSHPYKFNLYGVWGQTRLGPISTDTITAAAPAQKEPPSQPRLGELTASHVSPDSVQLEWSVPEGSFDSFTVQYKDAQGQPQVVPVDGGLRTVTVPGLSPSRRYKFNLYGVWGRKRLGPMSTDAVTAPAQKEPPSQPLLGELTASHVGPDSVQLEWSVPEGSFDSFTVQYKDAQGQPQVVPVDGGLRTVTVPGLSPSRRYKFNLYGVWGRKRLGPMSTDAVTAAEETEEEPPSQPRLGELTASHVSPNSVQLEWSIPEGSFDSFTVQYIDVQGQPQELHLDSGSRTVTVSGLLPSHPYKFNLYGVWGQTRLGPISTDTITAAAPAQKEPPSQPRLGELTASHVSPDSVQLEWSVPEGSFDSFTVQYKDAQGQPQVVPVDGGLRTVTVPGLSPSRRYKFNLYGVWGRKRLGPMSTDAVTAPAQKEPPSQPLLGELTASHVGPDSVQLEWSVPEGSFDSFTVQYKDAQGQPQVVPVDGGLRTVTVPGLSPSRRYKFNLYGVWGRKRLGPMSTDAVTAPAQKEPPSQPLLGELTASHVGPDSVQLEWSVPEGSFDSFTVQYKDAQGQPQVVPVDGGLRTVTVPGLSPSRRYKFNLYGVWGRKRLGPMSTDAVTAAEETEEEPPSQPRLGELTASHVSPNSVQLEWSIPEGSFDSFTVQYIDVQGQPQELHLDSGSRTVTVSGLLPSHPYKFNLYGVWGQTRLGPISTDTITAAAPAQKEPPSQPRLGELTASHVSPDSVQLEWSVPEGSFDSFTVQYKDAQGQPQVVPVDSGLRTVTVPGLSPSRRYKFNLYGVWGRKRLGPMSTDAVTAAEETEEEPPSQPRLGELTASHVSPNSVQLEWSIPEGSFDSFTVQYIDVQGQPQELHLDSGSRTVTVSGLLPSHPYKFNLYGVWGQTRLGPISTDTITAAAPAQKEPPSQPRLGELTASHVSPDSVQLEWSVPEGSFDSFTVQYKDAQGQPQVVPVDGGLRTVTVPGLSPSRRYKFNLYGVWGRKRLGPMSTDAVTGAPGTLWVGTLWPRSAHLHWAPPHVPPEGYNLIYGPPGGPVKTLQLPPEATSKELWGLEPSGRYRVQLWGRGLEPLETTFDTREQGHPTGWGLRMGAPTLLCPSAPLPHPHPRDCAEEQLNGPGPSREVLIFLGGDRQRPLHVFCDMESNGGGWLVFQRRMDGGTDFWRGWEEYIHGFGNVSGEFWLGNAALHTLTASGPTELRVDLRTPSDSAFARYRDFAVSGPEDNFRLHLGAYSGTAGDALSYHAGSPFSTRDHDPRGRPRPCAVAYTGAWWYRNCHYANLNGRYGVPYDHQGINWYPWKGFEYSIPFTEMKLRPQRD
ncbi:tenascin-X isoform X9 [Gallus gallus]|uniref:tenascin-X isoform X9 n=1 Tax=Gallus gallus TaxID=9031 RepID=UPI000D63EAE5|nr:tenascin-X isoform X9 [Gallus gallus]XP_040541198.1 tenascin-X isoform X9 [Gallus gallus]|eukprot:XP_025011569.1 tenascin-X isoform X7 [Gallus gallus]